MNSYNTNKLMVMEFSRYALWKLGGFTKEMFINILEALPSGTEIRGFSERANRDVYSILLSHDSFPEVTEAQQFPEIIAIIEHLSNDIRLEWPDSYKTNHVCQFKTYQGFSKTEEICIVCGVSK